MTRYYKYWTYGFINTKSQITGTIIIILLILKFFLNF